MTPTTSIGTEPMPVPSNGTDMMMQASQNLFEHMASTSSTTAQAITPAELGTNIMNMLEGPIERIQHFSVGWEQGKTDASQAAINNTSVDGGQATPSSEGSDSGEVAGLGDTQLDRMIESLSSMFDYATEARLLTSCASQVSGACTTLLRGQ